MGYVTCLYNFARSVRNCFHILKREQKGLNRTVSLTNSNIPIYQRSQERVLLIRIMQLGLTMVFLMFGRSENNIDLCLCFTLHLFYLIYIFLYFIGLKGKFEMQALELKLYIK